LPQASFLLAEPLFPEYSRRRTESLEHIQRVPDRRHEPFFERGHEDAIRDPVSGIGGRLTIRDHLKLLHDRPGLEEEFAHLLKEEDRAVGWLRHEFCPCFPPCAFMAAGSVAERERFETQKTKPQPTLTPGRL